MPTLASSWSSLVRISDPLLIEKNSMTFSVRKKNLSPIFNQRITRLLGDYKLANDVNGQGGSCASGGVAQPVVVDYSYR
jgi:hypothetical protein